MQGEQARLAGCQCEDRANTHRGQPALGALNPYTIPVAPLSGVDSVRLQPVEPSGEKLGNRRGRLKALQENLYHSGERNG